MNNLELIKYGIITESCRYTMDGEHCTGYKEIDVEVTEYWKTGDSKNQPKEVKVKGNDTHYRLTAQSGWRLYHKKEKRFDNKYKYIGGSASFKPNIAASTSKNYFKVTLGGP